MLRDQEQMAMEIMSRTPRPTFAQAGIEMELTGGRVRKLSKMAERRKEQQEKLDREFPKTEARIELEKEFDTVLARIEGLRAVSAEFSQLLKRRKELKIAIWTEENARLDRMYDGYGKAI